MKRSTPFSCLEKKFGMILENRSASNVFQILQISLFILLINKKFELVVLVIIFFCSRRELKLPGTKSKMKDKFSLCFFGAKCQKS